MYYVPDSYPRYYSQDYSRSYCFEILSTSLKVHGISVKSPHELDGSYEDLINRVEDTDLVEAGKLFQWVCFTGRHLSLDELRIAMTVYLTGSRKFLAEYEDESNPHYIMNDRKMKKRMVYLSRGLVGITIRWQWKGAQQLDSTMQQSSASCLTRVFCSSTAD